MVKAAKKSKKSSKKKVTEFKKLTPSQVEALDKKARRKYKHQLRIYEENQVHEADLARLPKNKFKRFFAKLSPRYVWHFLKSWRGQKKILKFIAVCCLLGIIALGGLFAYYKQQLKDIELSNINISETVNTYLDRNGKVLWEDTGSDNYRLVVDGTEISTYMRQATVAIEDKNFYNHPGIDVRGLTRAVIATATGQGVQGGSTLTQQLIKQVYFSDEAASANRGGITRKIKELILAIELEKMYDKEKIITMYLNESPYGGRRNGVESAARTYFGKAAADLDLAESALLAAIPNNPAVLNPYNEYGHEALIVRQQKALDAMVELGYISSDEAQSAKEVDILSRILPESSQYSNILAPHFVLEVKDQLEEKYGLAFMRQGGLTITTTLDYRAQELAEKAVAAGAAEMYKNGSDNIGLASVDVETGQVIAMVGSVDFTNKAYGEVNSTTSLLEPGSSIKPIIDYAPLFMEREGQNYGPGTIIRDENIDYIYCAGYVGSCSLRNASGAFYGSLSIRQSLGNSLNIAAVKALYINGIENSLDIAHRLGDISYCADGSNAGLSMAIGSGCNVRIVEHANAFASLARGGAYKELAYILEVKNSSGDIVDSWSETEADQVVDPQVAFLLEDILSDANARNITFGSQGRSFGFVVPDVWTASKTGTTTTASSSVTKDSWMVSFSTAIATAVWNGNHDGGALTSSTNEVVRRVIANYMEPVHKEVYAVDGKWSSGDKPVQPAGIKKMNGDLWPSWYDNSKSGSQIVKLEFNKLNNLLAAECTPAALRVSVDVTKTIDPFTKKEIWSVPEPYNREKTDDCSTSSYSAPSISASVISKNIRINVNGFGTLSYKITVDGVVVEDSVAVSSSFISDYTLTGSEKSIQVTVTDSYGASASDSVSVPASDSSD